MKEEVKTTEPITTEEVKVGEKRETLTLPEKQEEPQDLMTEKPIEEMTDAEIVEAARKFGHRPKEAHKGDPDRWQDPETFLKLSREQTPALRNQIKKDNQIIETQNKIIENLKKNAEKEKENLEPKMKEAWEEQDFDKYKNLEKQEKELTKQVSEYDDQIVKVEEPAMSNELGKACAEWDRSHPEYYTDPRVKEVADKELTRLIKQYPDGDPRRIIELVTIAVNNIKSTTSMQSTSSKPSTMSAPAKTRSYDNLTESAKKVCNNFVNAGCDKDAYIKNSDDTCFIWYK